MLCAKDVMTGKVISIRPDSTVVEAARLMIRHGISAVPVIEDDRLVGLVSEGDLIHRAEIGTAEQHRSRWLRLLLDVGSLAEEYARTHSRRAADVMVRDVTTVQEDTSVADIADLMDRRRIKRVPVMRGETVVGIVSRADLLKAIVAQAEALASSTFPPDDRAVTVRLREELQQQPWATVTGSNVEVSDGVVSLWGWVGSERERKATRVLAENLPGVRDVEDHRVVLDFPVVSL